MIDWSFSSPLVHGFASFHCIGRQPIQGVQPVKPIWQICHSSLLWFILYWSGFPSNGPYGSQRVDFENPNFFWYWWSETTVVPKEKGTVLPTQQNPCICRSRKLTTRSGTYHINSLDHWGRVHLCWKRILLSANFREYLSIGKIGKMGMVSGAPRGAIFWNLGLGITRTEV